MGRVLKALSRRLAEMMGGELTYRHYEGWGTFALTLPEAPEESIHPDATSDHRPLALSPRAESVTTPP